MVFKDDVASIIACCCLIWCTVTDLGSVYETRTAVDAEISRLLLLSPIMSKFRRHLPLDDILRHPWERSIASAKVLDMLDQSLTPEEKDDFVSICKEIGMTDYTVLSVVRRGLMILPDDKIDRVVHEVATYLECDISGARDLYSGLFTVIQASGI